MHDDAMTVDPQRLEFAYRRCADQQAASPARHSVVIVGAGPVGLTLAIDLAQRGVRVLLLDDDHRLSTGSRAICFAKHTLEIWDRLGVGASICAKGVRWNVGRVFLRDQPVYAFDLLPEPGHERPAFVNLPQYQVEACLVERALALPLIEIRWDHKVVGVQPGAGPVALQVETPEGRYTLHADYLAACDGSRSTLRAALGLETQGRVFRDRFLIADIRTHAALFPPDRAERWFWFDPPFHPGQSVLLHQQPEGVWRVDFQLGWDADPDVEKRPERIVPRIQALLAHSAVPDASFELVWASVYSFGCQRMQRFRHGRVLFAGDAAHVVSPFGARGANSGVQDADNLGWKLAAVLQRQAGDALLDSYGIEREAAADENIRHSTRSTDFITPKNEASRLFRDATLSLAREHAFARRLVNSGRLSTPTALHDSPLNSADSECFDGSMRPGAVAADAPLQRDGRPVWLLRQLGDGFSLLFHGAAPAWAQALPLQTLAFGDGGLSDVEGLAARRYDLRPGSAVLIRPDRHICARWRTPSAAGVAAALARALAATSAANADAAAARSAVAAG